MWQVDHVCNNGLRTYAYIYQIIFIFCSGVHPLSPRPTIPLRMVGRSAYIPTAKSWEQAIHSTIPSKSNQYWSAIRPLLVTTRSSTGHYYLPVLVHSATSTGSFYPSHSFAHRDRRRANAYLYWSAGEPIWVEMQTNIGRCVKLYRFTRRPI